MESFIIISSCCLNMSICYLNNYSIFIYICNMHVKFAAASSISAAGCAGGYSIKLPWCHIMQQFWRVLDYSALLTRNNADFCKAETASRNTSINLLNQVPPKQTCKKEEQLKPLKLFAVPAYDEIYYLFRDLHNSSCWKMKKCQNKVT